MIAVYGRVRPQQRLIHFDAAADLSCAHGISRDGLIHIGQPCERGRRAARAALRHAIGLERARGLEDGLVDVGKGIHGILRRLVMVRRVVAHGHGIDVVELRAVVSPIANEFLRELLVVSLHFGHSRTKSGQIARHASVLAILIQDEPLGMFLHDFGHDVLVRLPLPFAVLRRQGQPPELHQHALLVEVIGHFLDGIVRERIGTRVPIAVCIEPAIVKRGPLNTHLL